MIEPPAMGDLSQTVVDAMAPAFVLAAMAGWVRAMMSQLVRTVDRVRYLSDHERSGSIGQQAMLDLANLKALAAAIELSIFWMICGAIFIVLYVILAFVMNIFSVHYTRLIIYVFVVALIFLLISLITFARHVWVRKHNRIWM